MDRVFELSAVDIARSIARAERSALDVAEEHLSRIGRHNHRLNAVVTVDADAVRRRARAADAALSRGELWGPLHGVPITVKDSFETAGLRTTSSHPPMSGYVPDRDATAVSRLVGAGAIVLGKTNLPELERDVQSWSPLFGHANNPWDTDLTPGGSTGGGAAAVAAGLSPLELGSDTAGSVRIPAHYTGTFALKPTERRVSLAGKVPPRHDRPRGMRHVAGAIARCLDDLDLWLGIVEGPDPRDPDTSPRGIDDGPLGEDRPLRLAWTRAVPEVPVGQATQQAIAELAVSLAAAGNTVTEVAVPFEWTAALQTYGEIWGAECGLGLPAAVRALAPIAARFTGAQESIARGIGRGMRFDMTAYARALGRRDDIATRLADLLETFDAWLLPVTSGPAFPHREPGLLRAPAPIEVDGHPVSYDLATLGYTAPISTAGNPAVTMPLPRPSGELPIGVQVIGLRWQDRRLLDVCRWLRVTTGPFRAPPGFA